MSGWTKGEVIALFSFVMAVLGVAANNPELRCSLFKDCSGITGNPPPPVPSSSAILPPQITPIPQPPSPSIPTAPSSEPALISIVTGVDYSPLRDLLAAGQWKEADELTWKLMLKAAKREQEGWLDSKSLENFSCSDLKTIDQLWVKYSQGKFGFSVQKQLYLSVGGKLGLDNWTDQDYYNYSRFAIMVGWKTGIPNINNSNSIKNYEDLTEKGYKIYNDLTFNVFAPNGHLPVRYALDIVGSVESWTEGMGSKTVLLLSCPNL
jgi:hypothetical protein